MTRSPERMRIRFLARLVHSALTVVILGPALVSARPPNPQRNYGLLGNVLASLVDVFRGRFGGSYQATRDDAKRQSINRRNRDIGKKKGYGPLGRLLVTFIGESLGYISGHDSRGVSVQDADPQKSFIVMQPEGTDRAESAEDAPEKQRVSNGRERLRGLRELLRVLWSNFLPDPTFDRAVLQLMKRDADQLDMVFKEGSYITVSQREQLLALAGECDSKICTTVHQ